MNTEKLKAGKPIWVRGYTDGFGNIDFLGSDRDGGLDYLSREDILQMSDNDLRLDDPDLKTDKNQETFEHLMKGIKNLACFGGNAVLVTAPIVIDENVIVVTVSEPSLNDKKYQNLSPYFNERGNK